MELADKRVLVTGGAGFIGSHLVDELLRIGCRVRVIDNLANGKRKNVQQHEGNPSFQFINGDITKGADLIGALDGIEVVFHLACLGVRHSLRFPFENHRVNAEGTLMLLQQAHKVQVKKFIHCSSSEVYGTASFVPMPETHPTLPCTVYGASKLAGEAYARAFHRTYGMNVVVLRPFNTYGPRSHHEGDAGEIIPKSIVRTLNAAPILIFGSGTQTRDFTFVTDTARALVCAAMNEELTGMTCNIGTGCEISMRDLAHKIAAASDAPTTRIEYHPNRPGDVLRLCADARSFSRITDWHPCVTLEQGLAQTARWFQTATKDAKELLQQEVGVNWE